MRGLKKEGLLVLLKYPGFLKIWLGNLISRLGDSIDSIAFMWMIYELTGSSILMGTILTVNFLPNLLFGMFAGVLVDRWKKKSVMLVGDIGRGVGVAVIAVLFVTGNIKPWYLYVITFINSTLETFTAPARSAVIPRLVTNKEDFLAANSLFRASSSLAEIVGLGLAGTIIGFWGLAAAFVVDAISFFFCAFFIFITKIPLIIKETEADNLSYAKFSKDFKEGMRAVFKTPLIRLSVFMGMGINLVVSPFTVLAPIYVDKVFTAGPEAFSFLATFLTIGILVGSLLIGNFGKKIKNRVIIISGVLLMGLGLFGFYMASYFYYAIIAGFILGFGVAILSAVVSSIVMTYTPQELMGRVSSVMNCFMMAAMPAGTAVAGVLANSYKTTSIFFVCSILLFVVAVVLSFNSDLKTGSINLNKPKASV